MQNKPNFRKAEMKLSFYSTKDYENQGRLRNSKNKPNQTQFQNGHLCQPKLRRELVDWRDTIHERRGTCLRRAIICKGVVFFWIKVQKIDKTTAL